MGLRLLAGVEQHTKVDSPAASRATVIDEWFVFLDEHLGGGSWEEKESCVCVCLCELVDKNVGTISR